MQYIQLQGQSAPEMDTPLAGSYNLFIDGSDGSVKIKDDQGNWYGDSSLISVTYSELRTLQDNSELRTGSYYLISNFRTCYDQPNYDYNGNAITTGNYKQGNVSPIIVFAISSSQISEIAYQPEFPGDIIHYDPSFSVTEVTSGAAFGRITYRKDNQGNSFDYDFREVLFKRYDGYFSESVFAGTVSIDGSGNVTGTNTSFTDFAPGNIIGLLNINSSPLVSYYQIVSIADDTNMVVTGRTFNSGNDLRFVDANLISRMSWKQNNIISDTNSTEYLTFGNHAECFNNTCGNTAAYTVWNENTFLLSNNVFRGGEYVDNSFGSEFRNNTFNDDCISNTIRGNFYNNIITNDFDRNTINGDFYDNVIDCDFQNNLIMESFNNNNLGDDDGGDFNDNILNCTFYNNFFIGYNDFDHNTIKDTFNQNIVLRSFSKNVIGSTYNNTFVRAFDNNTVGDNFYSNDIYYYYDNNTIGKDFHDNTLGAIDNNNSYFENNQIGVSFKGNLIPGNFTDNRIGNFFMANEVGDSFNSNNIGNFFIINNIGYNFSSNFIMDGFALNNIENNFQYNRIGNRFYDNNIDNDFGSGGGGDRGNVIGNNFSNNTIGEYFYDNNIADNFTFNTAGYDFQFNRIETPLNLIDFTALYGNIAATSISSNATNLADGSYAGVTGSTNSVNGVGALFDISITGGTFSHSINNSGKFYSVNDSITISGTSIGGANPDDNIVLTVTNVSPTPVVYTTANSNIVKNFNGDLKLTYIGTSFGIVGITEPFD